MSEKKLDYSPEDKKFAGAITVVTGKVELFKGKPQIVVNTPDQLNLIYYEEVP